MQDRRSYSVVQLVQSGVTPAKWRFRQENATLHTLRNFWWIGEPPSNAVLG